VRLFRRAIAADPKNAEAHMNLGVALSLTDNRKGARESFEAAGRLKPGSADIQYNLGLANMESGTHKSALKHFQKAARASPKSAKILGALATVQMQLGLVGDSLRSFKKAAAAAPTNSAAQRNLGMALYDSGNRFAAVDAFAKAHRLSPDDASTKIHYATSLAQVRRTFEALPLFRAVLQEKPDLPGSINNYGLALKSDCRFGEAVDAFQKALVEYPGDPQIGSNLADAQVLAGKADEALATLRSLPDSRERDHVTNQIANILERLGRFDEAAMEFKKVLHRDPNNVWAYAGLIDGHCRGLSASEESTLVRLVDSGSLPHREYVRAAFALGHLNEDRGEYDTAFTRFAAGNRIRARAQPFDIGAHRRRTSNTIKAFSPDLLSRTAELSTESDLPVFVVGLPRSGTTLVERMLSAHPQAHGAGEFQDLFVIRQNLPHLVPGWTYPACVGSLTRKHTGPLAKWLLARRRALAPEACRVIEKTPAHVFDLGLAALLIATPKIIHCYRDPMDTCLSIFTNAFGGQHAYAGDLRSIAAFASDVARMMRHWKSILPVHNVSYESLVEDSATVASKMVAHIDLGWDDTILAYRSANDPVATASRWQVRQPIYRTSIGRWKKYETFLSPLRDALEEFSEVN